MNYYCRVLIQLEETISALFVYDENTTAGDIVKQIKAKYNEDFSDYGLVFAFTVFLKDDKKLIADYGILGEETVEFKMNSWALTFADNDTKREHTLSNLDPDDTWASVIDQLSKIFPTLPEEEYGIYAMPKDSNPTLDSLWLEDTKPLHKYKQLKNTVCDSTFFFFILTLCFFFSAFIDI